MTNVQHEKFRVAHLPSSIVQTAKEWMADDPFRLSAVVAYYAVLSLPALLVIILNIVGSIWGTEVVQGQLTDEFTTALGTDAAASIETMVAESQNKEKKFNFHDNWSRHAYFWCDRGFLSVKSFNQPDLGH